MALCCWVCTHRHHQIRGASHRSDVEFSVFWNLNTTWSTESPSLVKRQSSFKWVDANAESIFRRVIGISTIRFILFVMLQLKSLKLNTFYDSHINSKNHIVNHIVILVAFDAQRHCPNGFFKVSSIFNILNFHTNYVFKNVSETLFKSSNPNLAHIIFHVFLGVENEFAIEIAIEKFLVIVQSP